MIKYPSVFGLCVVSLIAFNNAEITVIVALSDSFRLQIFPKTLNNPTNCTLTSPQGVTTDIPLDYQDSDTKNPRNPNANQNSHDDFGDGWMTRSQIYKISHQLDQGHDELPRLAQLKLFPDITPQAADDQRITPLGNEQCGARVHNATSADVGRWTLTLLNADQESVIETYRIRTVAAITYTNTTSTAVIGDSGTIILCGPSNMLYCELKNPLGNVVTLTSATRCETILDGVKATDYGTWTCTVGVAGSTTEIHATHKLEIGDPAEEVVISSNQTSLGYLISWQVFRIIPAASWCRAFPPSGESILVSPGLEVEKYVSAGTDLTANKCGLLIKGDITEEYVGVWRLEMGLTSRRIVGGFIMVPEGSMPEADDPTTSDVESGSKPAVEVTVAAGKPFAITCQTQYPAGYCWIKGPHGQMITSTDELTVGRCSHSINTAVSNEHNGTWTCNMAHVNGGHEEHLVTNVNVIDKLYRALSNETTVRRGERAVIACKSVLDCPLQYCRFVRPDGTGLGVKPGMEPSGRYSYEGPGLDHGYCGLAISSVQEVDIGEWTCVSRSRFRTWEEENWDTSVLQLPETSVASVIGLTMGLIMLVVIAAGVLFVRHRRRRSESSEESMIVEYNS